MRMSDTSKMDKARADFHATADKRLDAVIATGNAIPWADMRRYLQSRLAGKPTDQPVAKSHNASGVGLTP